MSAELTSKNTRAPIAYGPRGIELATYEDAFRFADSVVKSGLAPKGMERPESVLVAIQMGAELGLAPMQSLQNIAVINGRPAVWGDAMLAICRGSGLFDESAFVEVVGGEGEKRQASCTVRRLPNGNPCTRVFSMADAKRAGLVGKAGPWSQYPDRMMQMRARSWALRDTFSDLLRGIAQVEEVKDMTPIKRTTARVVDAIETYLPPPPTTDDGEIIESGVRGDFIAEDQS